MAYRSSTSPEKTWSIGVLQVWRIKLAIVGDQKIERVQVSPGWMMQTRKSILILGIDVGAMFHQHLDKIDIA